MTITRRHETDDATQNPTKDSIEPETVRTQGTETRRT